VRRDHAFLDSGITGMRAMAVDYSGRSSAPCMIVMVDRIEGAKALSWPWQLHTRAEGIMQKDIDKSGTGRDVFEKENYQKAVNGQLLLTESAPFDDERIQMHDDGFTFTQQDATMRATFVAPSRPELELAERVQYHRTNVEVIRRTESRAIFADGSDGFFVILTFQSGPAPKVEVLNGEGLNAIVKVGEQTVRFDGERIILGD
jgi:hypothetical protein